MALLDIIFLGIGVSIDALTIGICKGINSKHIVKTAFACGCFFALFQFIMPLIGFVLGEVFQKVIDAFDHYLVFALLSIFGIKLIKEGLKNEEQKEDGGVISIIFLAFFSSFDSLGVGLSLGLFDANLWVAIIIICGMTFAFGFFGVFLGKLFGKKHRKIICVLGGLILIALGIKFLIKG